LVADSIKLLLGSGGLLGFIVLVVRWWRTRPRVRVRFVRETYDLGSHPNIEVTLQVEVENTGRESTSVQPTVVMQCLTAGREMLRHSFSIQDTERTLQPVTPKALTLKATLSASYAFSKFRVFSFSLSRGRSERLRLLNASGHTASLIKFKALEWCYRVLRIPPC
jgi:hypothetical protein